MNLRDKCYASRRYKELNEIEKEKLEKELKLADRYYENGIDLEKKLRKTLPNTKHLIPFLLGITDGYSLLDFDYIQVKDGASGGIDIDYDMEGEGREKVVEFLKKNFGEENVLHVGTLSTLGLKAAIKDVLRVYGVDYKETNEFTKELDANLSFKENYELKIKNNIYLNDFYEKHKEKIEIALRLVDKIRGRGKHAGGIIVSDKPIYEYIPVERVQGEIVSAYEESGQNQVLDEIGLVKIDLLGISVLDTIKNAINLIDEDLYLIEEDGIEKIVGESYIKKEINEF